MDFSLRAHFYLLTMISVSYMGEERSSIIENEQSCGKSPASCTLETRGAPAELPTLDLSGTWLIEGGEGSSLKMLLSDEPAGHQ